MAGGREIEEETRNQMMQNLFGDQSEEEEEDDEEEGGSENEPPPLQSNYQSDEGEVGAEIEGEGEVGIEGQGEVEGDSEAELHGVDPDQGESEAERGQSSQGRELSDQRSVSGPIDVDSEEEGYGQRVVTSRRREVIASDSERSDEHHYVNNEDEEVGQPMKSRSPTPSEGHEHAVVRDVFGESDEDVGPHYEAQNELERDPDRSPMEEYNRSLGPEDMVPDEEAQYESEDENIEQKLKEKPVGPPLNLAIPLQQPPGLPEKVNMIRVSNIMGIEPKPYDPKTFEEEDVFVTDESGAKKRIRLEDNIVRWRRVRNRDGSESVESNARFVRWSDGSLQLLIGNEVLDISVQEAHHDHTHLFLKHGKGIIQSQGRLLRKMRFMPSSLSSKSHRLLTALVDSRHKKVYKVKNCITDVDPEREKEEKERAEGQSIRANEMLQRKREKVSKKYTPSIDKGRQLSPGFLEEALDEDEEPEDYYNSRRAPPRRRFEEDLELESQAEKRIMNAKRSHLPKDNSRRPPFTSANLSRHSVENYSESDREESEYETEGEDIERSPVNREAYSDQEDEYEEEQNAEEEDPAAAVVASDDEEEEPRRSREIGGGNLKRKELESDDDESPPRKAAAAHRRKTVVFYSDEDE